MSHVYRCMENSPRNLLEVEAYGFRGLLGKTRAGLRLKAFSQRGSTPLRCGLGSGQGIGQVRMSFRAAARGQVVPGDHGVVGSGPGYALANDHDVPATPAVQYETRASILQLRPGRVRQWCRERAWIKQAGKLI